ncbi:MAG: hypothetical protein QGG50_08440 [Methanopyri archaeon]|jgi:hypothetical protein|nr:hypothetical protein [Methanopyri archaeon]
MSDITLCFEGPFGLCGDHPKLLFNEEISHSAGVYLWVVRYKDGYLVHYIGETGTSFNKRMKEHMIQTLGGNYRVCNPEALREGKEKIMWDGLWRRGTRDKMPEFVDRYVELSPVIRDYLEVIEVLVAPLQVESRVRRRIEGALARSIQDQPSPASNLLPDDIRYTTRKKDEVPIPVHVMSHTKGLDLPNRISV